jgi:hypothetical protein
MSGYLTRLLAGAVHPQRAVRPLLGPLFGWPSAGPEWLLRESRPRHATAPGGAVDAERIFDDEAVRQDSPAAMPAPAPPRFAAASPTRAGAEDPSGRAPELGGASHAGREPDHLHPRVHEQELGRGQERGPEYGREHAAALRDATRETAAPDDAAVAPPLPDRWRARRPSAETLRLDQTSAEPDPGAVGRSVPRSAALGPAAGKGGMPAPTAAPARIARLPPHRDGEMDLIRRYAPHPYHGSPQRAQPDHEAHPPRIAEAMAAEAMAAAVRPAAPTQSPSGRDLGLLGATARRARSAAPEPAQRHGAENRHGAEMRRAQVEPTVHVTIGTVEIKAAVRSNPPRPPPASPAAPRVGLEEYLRQRRMAIRYE